MDVPFIYYLKGDQAAARQAFDFSDIIRKRSGEERDGRFERQL